MRKVTWRRFDQSAKQLVVGQTTIFHLDAQYGQTWHLLTQLRREERTCSRLLWSTTLLLPTLLSDSQVSISLVIHGLWWTVSGQVKAHVVWTCTNGVSPNHLPVFLTNHEPHCQHIIKIWRRTESAPQSGWWQSYVWNLQQLQHS